MARACSICSSEGKEEINRLLISGVPMQQIATRTGKAYSSVRRHRDNHLAPRLSDALARYVELDADRVVRWAVGLHERTVYGLTLAEGARNQAEDEGKAAAGVEVRAWLAEARKSIDLLGRLSGVIEAGGMTVNVDARKQVAVIASMTEDELRALASQAAALEQEHRLPQPVADGKPLEIEGRATVVPTRQASAACLQ